MIGQEPIKDLAFPICKTYGVDGRRGGFFDLNKTMKWVRENGTDPILTSEPMDWDHYRAVRWTNADNLPVYTNRLHNHRATERLLRLLKKGVIGQNIPPPFEDQYIQFRILMAQLATDEDAVHQIDWLREYWGFHPYDEQRDAPLINPPHPTTSRHFTRARWNEFRFAMGRRLQTNPGDPLVAQYWKFHA